MKILSYTRLLASLALVALVTAPAAAQSLVAHYTFDEGINDYSQNSSVNAAGASSDAVWQDGTAGLTWGAGQIGGAAILDGQNGNHHFDIANLSGIDMNLTGITISAWINPVEHTAGQNYKGVVMTRAVEDSSGMMQNWGLAYVRDLEKVEGRFSNEALRSDAGIVPNGNWMHAVMVWDPDFNSGGNDPVNRLYLDGVEVTDSPDTTPLAASIFSGGLWSIGSDPGNTSRNFQGAIDDVAIYSGVVSAAGVTTLYSNGVGAGGNSTDAAGNVVVDYQLGDVDLDGDIDGIDYDAIELNFNQTATGRDDGDLNGDGLVDLNDFAEWRDAATPAVLASRGFGAVPEPSTLALMGLAGLFGLGRTRRRS